MTEKAKSLTAASTIIVVAILVIGILEGMAIYRGIDGKAFGIAIAAIAGLAGFKIKSILS